MPRDPSFEPFRTFYREGGYVSAPEPAKPSRMQEIEMALWGSQHFADGGEVGSDGLPHFGGGGAQIMRKGFEPAMQAVMEYLGGLKRNPIQVEDTGYMALKKFQEKRPTTTAPIETGDTWDSAVRRGVFPYTSKHSYEEGAAHPAEIMAAMRRYTSSDYSDFNNAYRKFSENTYKNQNATVPYGKHWWETGNIHPYDDDVEQILRGSSEMDIAKQARDLGKYLQDMETELPYDIYRGARFRVKPDDLLTGEAPELHGRGLGSFTFHPGAGLDWGDPNFQPNVKEYYSGAENLIHKVPSSVRIPQGTKVRGANIAPYSEMNSEFEFLMAPFQGFDVTDVNLVTRPDTYGYNKGRPYNRLLLDAVPSNSYNPNSPAIYHDGGEVAGYAGGGEYKAIMNYIRGISQPVKTHHVSPYDFDRFDSSYIGKGEGNKNFGHGLYFMESPSLRDRYINDLGEQFPDRRINAYDVNIHEDPARFLSLDEPLDTQGTIGRRAAEYLQAPRDWVLRPPDRLFPRMEDQVTDPAFSRFMSDEGASGTRYLDSRSKKLGRGTENYVTFPSMDDILEITGKYAAGGEVRDLMTGYAGQFYADGGPVLGITGLKAMQQYTKALKDMFKRPITVAAPDEAWPKIVSDGRFKSQFETGRSEGSYEPQHRARTERDLFGLPEDLDPSLRPIYGHVTDRNNIRNSDSYGRWGAVLDPSVNARSTFHLDDSLGSEPSKLGPYRFKEGWEGNEPYLRNWMKELLGERWGRNMRDELPDQMYGPRGFKPDEPISAGLLPRVAGFPYIEAQVHNGLPWSDVRAMVSKRRTHDPDFAAADAQKMADIVGRPSFASWANDVIGNSPPEWMLAHPGESVNKVLRVPDTTLDRYGYADGGLANVFGDAPHKSLAPEPMMAPPIVPLPLLAMMDFGSANAGTGNVSGTIGGPGVSSESAVGDAGATGGVGGSASSEAGVGGSAAAGVGGDDGGTYAGGGYLRHLMTGYDGQFYNDGGIVHTIAALNRLRGN